MESFDYALINLAARAEEDQQPGGLFRDTLASQWHRHMCEKGLLSGTKLNPIFQAAIVMRTALIDYAIIDHVNQQGSAARIFEMGCGYSTRPSRLRSLPVCWVNVDRGRVMNLRGTLPVSPSWREMNIPTNFETSSFKEFGGPSDAMLIFEGVLTYMSLDKVRRMFDILRSQFRRPVVIGTAMKEGYGELTAEILPVRWTVQDIGATEGLLGVELQRSWVLSELSYRMGYGMGPKMPEANYIWQGLLKNPQKHRSNNRMPDKSTFPAPNIS